MVQQMQTWQKDNSPVPISDGHAVNQNGNRVPQIVMKGWSSLAPWKDGSGVSWAKLSEPKERNPTEVVECAMAISLQKSQHSNGGCHKHCDDGIRQHQS